MGHFLIPDIQGDWPRNRRPAGSREGHDLFWLSQWTALWEEQALNQCGPEVSSITTGLKSSLRSDRPSMVNQDESDQD